MPRKRVIINADDFGLHPEIDAAILDLIEKKIVTSTSVMVCCSPTLSNLVKLRETEADCGLHIDFTSPHASATLGKIRPTKALIVAAWCRNLDPKTVRKSIDKQLDRFERLMIRAPRFVDGHEHVHQFPIIHEVLLDVLQKRYPNCPPFIRDTGPRRWRGTKAFIIGALGSSTLGKIARRASLPTNLDFAGVYDFAFSSRLAWNWDAWLSSLPEQGGLVMCHPAADIVPNDPISSSRIAEYAFLRSDTWLRLAKSHGVEPAYWGHIPVR